MFFKNQSKWLDISASREKQKDREEDLQSYIKDLESNLPKSAEESEKIRKIKNYLVANDPFLYVKMFALITSVSIIWNIIYPKVMST
jgi:hypothetical protein